MTAPTPISVEDLATYCKSKGFAFQSSEIYGGLSGVYDYGPMGVELKRAVVADWWRRYVTLRDDIVGIDGAIVSAGEIWEASGHTASFNDPIVADSKTGEQFRADHLIEDALGIATDGMSSAELQRIIDEKKLTSPAGNPLTPVQRFNLMFPVQMGASKGSQNLGYLRGETAQIIFTNFRNVADTSRVKLPFGIAQAGKMFRNEISPRDFLFRLREFEAMEIEYFSNPKGSYDWSEHFDVELLERPVLLLDEASQGVDEPGDGARTTLAAMIKGKKLTELHALWIADALAWYRSLGLSDERLRLREHVADELSHYSSATFDIEYRFPFGWKEIHGSANRGAYDLTQHAKHSGKKLAFHDEATGEKLLPSVIEPSFGIERTLLPLLFEAYLKDETRGNVVLRLAPRLAPIQVSVMPLVSNKPELSAKAREAYDLVKTTGLRSTYDRSGSIGRRYARADELGTPYCVTVDFESLEDEAVTVRDRDTTEQERVKLSKLAEWLMQRCR